MRKIVLAALMLLISVGWLAAQSSDQSGSSAQSSSGQATSSSSSQTGSSPATDQTGNSPTPDTSKSTKDNQTDELRGCITQVNGDYMFTSAKGRKYVLQGDQHLIGKHLGQAVEINGGAWRSTGTASTTAPTESTDGSASPRSITVKSITPIEGKCTPDYH
jgi:uncharacterized protein YdeI (BOF family)